MQKRVREMNKRGQEMSLTTILLIVLGLVVVVLLIWGFSTGWGNLWDTITNYIGGGSNIDTIKNACAVACSQSSKNDFCSLSRTIKFDEKRMSLNETKLVSEVKSTKGSCNDFATNNLYNLTITILSCGNLCAS